jgi:epoxyqueuosine reductase
MTIKNKIKSKANEIGFANIGFAKFELLDSEIKYYKEWLNKKYNASMDYLERTIDKRHNISLLLEGAKTIIVTATNYYQSMNYSNSIENVKIARYALGNDYHFVIKNMQNELINFIKGFYPNANFKNYVDTGSILERQWAVRAGLGWQGKNGLVISRNIGSWFFIGIIITDIEFESDNQIPNYCGTCRKCIDACPTNAIVNPSVIDANKCISYWTIAAKHNLDIPETINTHNPNWLFGCDICQEVCPWNKKLQQNTRIKEFLVKNYENEISLLHLIDITNEEFNKIFKNSAIKAIKSEGLKRNLQALKKKNLNY